MGTPVSPFCVEKGTLRNLLKQKPSRSWAKLGFCLPLSDHDPNELAHFEDQAGKQQGSEQQFLAEVKVIVNAAVELAACPPVHRHLLLWGRKRCRERLGVAHRG